jgi:hypothetical protein
MLASYEDIYSNKPVIEDLKEHLRPYKDLKNQRSMSWSVRSGGVRCTCWECCVGC